MCTELENIIQIRKILSNITIEAWGFKGSFISITDDEILALKILRTHIRDCYYVSDNDDVDFDNIRDHTEIYLALDTSRILNYFESFSSFLSANKYSIGFEVFYIQEFDYLHGKSSSIEIIDSYFLNLKLIEFTKLISDYNRDIAGELELFFYKSENGIAIKIDYSIALLESIKKNDFNVLAELRLDFSEKTDGKERKQLFVNELISLLHQKGNAYKHYVENWNSLIDNYKKSFSLYLSGFSFEKVKSSSIEHFHELTDRIHSTIIKFSAYIFGVPISYILVVRFLSFDGTEFCKDTLLVFLSGLFFILIWNVLFMTIDDAINAIKKDIESFKEKTGNDRGLNEIRNLLDVQYGKIIPRQENKIVIAKVISVLVLLVVFGAYIKIYSKSIKDHFSILKEWVFEEPQSQTGNTDFNIKNDSLKTSKGIVQEIDETFEDIYNQCPTLNIGNGADSTFGDTQYRVIKADSIKE